MCRYHASQHADNIILKAYNFAEEVHGNQTDDSGEPYVQAHCVNAYNILKQVTGDREILAASILHDVLEDTTATYSELEGEFGTRIASLVAEVTHDGQKDEHGYYFPRLNSRDAILIKFADRLSNLSRMEAWSEPRQQQYLNKSKFWKSE